MQLFNTNKSYRFLSKLASLQMVWNKSSNLMSGLTLTIVFWLNGKLTSMRIVNSNGCWYWAWKECCGFFNVTDLIDDEFVCDFNSLPIRSVLLVSDFVVNDVEVDEKLWLFVLLVEKRLLLELALFARVFFICVDVIFDESVWFNPIGDNNCNCWCFNVLVFGKSLILAGSLFETKKIRINFRRAKCTFQNYFYQFKLEMKIAIERKIQKKT